MRRKKIYHMIIQPLTAHGQSDEFALSHRREFLSTKQGDAPENWEVVGVCGYHEVMEKSLADDPEV